MESEVGGVLELRLPVNLGQLGLSFHKLLSICSHRVICTGAGDSWVSWISLLVESIGFCVVFAAELEFEMDSPIGSGVGSGQFGLLFAKFLSILSQRDTASVRDVMFRLDVPGSFNRLWVILRRHSLYPCRNLFKFFMLPDTSNVDVSRVNLTVKFISLKGE